MTDADALAIKAYLFSLAPVHAANRADTLGFPFNQRWLMGPWSFFFNEDVLCGGNHRPHHLLPAQHAAKS